MKSPVYGTQRGRRKNRKGPNHASAGNVKMRGKRFRIMGCNCCVCIDMRPRALKKLHQRRINRYMKGLD